MRKAILCILTLLLLLPAAARNWWPLPMDNGDLGQDSLRYSVGISAVASSGEFAPFWMHTNQHGRVSAAPYSGMLDLVLEKPATRPGRWWDYDFAIDLSGMAHASQPGNPVSTTLRRFPYWQTDKTTFLINRLYAHARLYIIDITAGVVPLAGCNPESDPALSVGDFLFSGNSPSMPRVSIGIDRYTAIPGLFGYLEIRGGLTHAWFTDNTFIHGGKLHYKYIGGRLGGTFPLNLSYEFHHAAQWGGTSPLYGDLGNTWDSYKRIFFGRSGGDSFNEAKNSLGNHLISQMWSLIAHGDGWRVSVTWQNFIDDNFMFFGTGKNLPDGLWGIHAEQSKWPFISGLQLEYLGTSDQSGPFHDQDGLIFAGNDNYYKNEVYRNGWNYNLHTIGTPFISSPLYNHNGDVYTHNSRTKVWHVGIRGDIRTVQYRALLSFARNYHMYDSGGDIYAEKSRNTAWLVELHKTFDKAWGLDFGLRVAGDIGNQFGNTGGVMLSIRKQGLITSY